MADEEKTVQTAEALEDSDLDEVAGGINVRRSTAGNGGFRHGKSVETKGLNFKGQVKKNLEFKNQGKKSLEFKSQGKKGLGHKNLEFKYQDKE